MSLRSDFDRVSLLSRLAFRRGELSALELEARLFENITAYPWARPGTETNAVHELLRREGVCPEAARAQITQRNKRHGQCR